MLDYMLKRHLTTYAVGQSSFRFKKETAFNCLKDMAEKSSLLTYPLTDTQRFLMIDASAVAIGATRPT